MQKYPVLLPSHCLGIRFKALTLLLTPSVATIHLSNIVCSCCWCSRHYCLCLMQAESGGKAQR